MFSHEFIAIFLPGRSQLKYAPVIHCEAFMVFNVVCVELAGSREIFVTAVMYINHAASAQGNLVDVHMLFPALRSVRLRYTCRVAERRELELLLPSRIPSRRSSVLSISLVYSRQICNLRLHVDHHLSVQRYGGIQYSLIRGSPDSGNFDQPVACPRGKTLPLGLSSPNACSP